MSDSPAVKVLRLNEKAILPEYQTSGSAGADLFATFNGPPIVLGPRQRVNVPTGICIEIPSYMEAQVRPRSGLALRHGVTVLNSPGTIDSDYRGEVIVILLNTSETSYTINSGDRIAQMVLAPVFRGTFHSVSQLGSSARGSTGLGSTGS